MQTIRFLYVRHDFCNLSVCVYFQDVIFVIICDIDISVVVNGNSDRPVNFFAFNIDDFFILRPYFVNSIIRKSCYIKVSAVISYNTCGTCYIIIRAVRVTLRGLLLEMFAVELSLLVPLLLFVSLYQVRLQVSWRLNQVWNLAELVTNTF